MPQDISVELHNFLEEVESIVQQEEDNLPEVSVQYIVSKFDKFDYDDFVKRHYKDEEVDGNPIEYDQVTETKTEISSDVKNDKIIKEIEDLEEYTHILDKLEDGGGVNTNPTDDDISSPQSEIEQFLENFIDVTVDKLLSNDDSILSNTEKTSLVASLVRQIESTESNYRSEVYFWGLGIEFEEHKISDRLSISRTSKDDLGYEVKNQNRRINYRLAPYRLPSFKLDLNCRAEGFSDLYNEYSIHTSLFRLFTGVSLQIVGYNIISQSELEENFQNWVGRAGEQERRAGMLTEGDQQDLREFYQHVSHPFRENVEENDEENYLSISFDRYENSIVYDNTIEEAIASTIMSLEALYLKENEKAELSERLAQRCGLLLGFCDYEPMEVYSRIKKGYDVRSSYVHGTQASDDFSDGLEARTVSFARQSLILFLQLAQEYDKDELISKIDTAIMSTNGREKLKDSIDDLCDYKPTRHNM